MGNVTARRDSRYCCSGWRTQLYGNDIRARGDDRTASGRPKIRTDDHPVGKIIIIIIINNNSKNSSRYRRPVPVDWRGNGNRWEKNTKTKIVPTPIKSRWRHNKCVERTHFTTVSRVYRTTIYDRIYLSDLSDRSIRAVRVRSPYARVPLPREPVVRTFPFGDPIMLGLCIIFLFVSPTRNL
jgi:hypothetical protein